MAYQYIKNTVFKRKFKNICRNAILFVQRKMHPYLTFQISLIGSGSRNMQMLNGKSKYVDLDYNLNIQRDKADLLNNPSELKEMAMDAFKEYFRKYNDVKVRNSTSAITVFLGNVDGYICSFDCAFIVEGNDGYYHKLVFDKNFQRYIWNRLPKSNGCFARYEWLKKNGYIAEIEELYREKKNHSNCDSSNLFVKTVNELFNKYEK